MELTLSKTVKFWQDEIVLYERTFEKWVKRGRKVQKRYKDIRSPREEAVTRFNVLWANVQTRLPALYARDPKPEVERRFKDRDPVGRVTSEVLERSIDYTIRHCNPFGRLMRQAVLDYELPGRGTVWVRYVPHFHKVELTPDNKPDNAEEKAQGHQVTNDADDEKSEERLSYEETQIDYVNWEDYGHTYARTEEEIRGKWRRVYLTRDELAERFELTDEQLNRIPMDWSPKTSTDSRVKSEQRPEQKKAIVYEIWDKQDRKALWLVKNYPEVLDEETDPLGLEGFFPCPPPLYANLVPDEMVPTPNFTYYQDQASEIDELSTRIAAIGKALKVAGVRDTSAEGLDRLLSEGVENQLIPVDGWIALKEKGGLSGVMELLPLKEIAEALGYLREQRQQLIDDIYQITGLSDIIRGLSDPNETATAQQIKGQFSVLRISDAQTEVQRFCRDTIRICAEIIAGYDLETLKQISGVKLLTKAEKEALSAQLAAAQGAMSPMPGGVAGGAGPAPNPGASGVVPGSQGPAGGNVPVPAQAGSGGGPPAGAGAGVPAPGQPTGPSPEVLKLLKEPSWEEVGALLKNKVLREFRIDIETDSTIRMDEESDKQARLEFLDRATNFITAAATTPPAMIQAVGECFLFAVRGFKVARNLERTFEDALEQLKNQPPRPDPEMMKVQAKVEGDKAIAQIKAQADMQVEQHKQSVQAQQTLAQNQAEDARKQRELAAQNAHEAQLEQMKQEFEGQKVAIEKASAERIAAAKNATDLQIAEMKMRHEAEQKARDQQHESSMTQLTQSHEKAMAEHQAKTGEQSERVKGEEARKTEATKGETAKETEKVRGENAERVAKVKPKAEADAAADGEKEKQKPMLDALEKLQEALKEARKPRKIVKNSDGTVELH